jgi:hypothetical protein
MYFKLTSPTSIHLVRNGYSDYISALKPGLYDANLLSFNWETGDFAPVQIHVGRLGGVYFQLPDGKRISYTTYRVAYPSAYSKSGTTIFLSSDLSKFLPAFLNYAADYVNRHSRLLAKGQATLTHLQSLASTYPEYIL